MAESPAAENARARTWLLLSIVWRSFGLPAMTTRGPAGAAATPSPRLWLTALRSRDSSSFLVQLLSVHSRLSGVGKRQVSWKRPAGTSHFQVMVLVLASQAPRVISAPYLLLKCHVRYSPALVSNVLSQ